MTNKLHTINTFAFRTWRLIRRGSEQNRAGTPEWRFQVAKEESVNLRIETMEGMVYRRARGREIRCRLTYEVTPFRDGLFRWFLIGIQELE